jgi:two-component system sensor histidine kinase DegS
MEAGGDGLGLLGMRERIALVDGRLEVESSPGSGTTLSFEVPVA